MPHARGVQSDAVQTGIERAARWVAAFPEEDLRFDAAVGLTMISAACRGIENADLRRAWRRARRVADEDHDNPMRRFWDSGDATAASDTSTWRVPRGDEPRVNVNRVLIEALHCRENGLRTETLNYLAGPMRDDGGYHTTHALWALRIAHDNGCVADADYQRIVRELRDELVKATPPDLQPVSTLSIDLFAERLLFLTMTGPGDVVIPRGVGQLLRLQNPDGSWGIERADEPPYYRYHATLVAVWTLCEFEASRSGSRASGGV